MIRKLWIGLMVAGICVLLYPQFAGAQSQSRDARVVLSFLKIDHGARMVGMGGAFVAIADDMDAIFSNVAGLTHIERAGFSLGYTRWLFSDGIYSGGFAYNTPHGVLGLSVVGFKPHSFEETTIFQPQGTGREPAMGNISIGLAYASKLTDRLSIGTLLRWTQETLDTDNLNVLDFSVSTLFYTGFKSLRLGMAFENLGKDLTLVEDRASMPVSFTIGGAMEILGEKGDQTYLTVTGENYYATDAAKVQYRLGGELWLQETLALRGGYKVNFDEETFSVGAGFKFNPSEGRQLRVDVSYTDFGMYLDAPIRFTVGGSF